MRRLYYKIQQLRIPETNRRLHVRVKCSTYFSEEEPKNIRLPNNFIEYYAEAETVSDMLYGTSERFLESRIVCRRKDKDGRDELLLFKTEDEAEEYAIVIASGLTEKDWHNNSAVRSWKFSCVEEIVRGGRGKKTGGPSGDIAGLVLATDAGELHFYDIDYDEEGGSAAAIPYEHRIEAERAVERLDKELYSYIDTRDIYELDADQTLRRNAPVFNASALRLQVYIENKRDVVSFAKYYGLNLDLLGEYFF